ncbi:MAG: PAS domain-containing protein [Gammaproteobacteria bacterium]|nr:PAS domain-containing protein [Gammaproteobacteria bacterium]
MSTKSFSASKSTHVAIILLLTFLIVGVWGVLRFVDAENARELLRWQDRMGVVADSRVDAIERWLATESGVVNGLAENTSLQLYLTQIEYADEGADTSPERTFLRNLLVATADRSGYLETGGMEGVKANVESSGRRGLALLNSSGEVVTATRDFPALDAGARSAIENAFQQGGVGIRDLYLNSASEPSMAFFAPIHAVQGDQLLGLAMAVRPVGTELYPLLRQRGLTTETHETLLVRRDNDQVLYLSPQADGTAPLKRRLALEPERLAAAFALAHPGKFAERIDYQGKDVLVISRALTGVPWVLVQKIDRAEALAEARGHALLIGLLLLVGVLGIALVAAWWYGSSVRSQQAAARLQEANERILGQSLMLNAITDNTNDFLAIINAGESFVFANRTLAEAVGAGVDEFAGKTLSAMLGADVAKQLESDLSDGNDQAEELVVTLEIGGRERRYSNFRIPLPEAVSGAGSYLLVMRDVTELLLAEERQERLMWELVETLSGVLDQHDPYSANHSQMVARLAEEVAGLMELDRGVQQTVRIAGHLINIGKLSIPREVLTKEGKLTDEEFKLLSGHLGRAREILSGIEFEGPVADAVGQSGEFLDGSGRPDGLKGEAIILPARILGAVNSFVAMTRPRAWRKGMDRQAAIDQLVTEHDRYDRRVLAALYHFISKHDDAAWDKLWDD